MKNVLDISAEELLIDYAQQYTKDPIKYIDENLLPFFKKWEDYDLNLIYNCSKYLYRKEMEIE